ncbi:MAG: hypothetical protein HQL56_01585 [Magnetococcales bacterium]|nr:hypothetical protein [Magnetococcales bacterium]
MRLWTLHPRLLDATGLVALWREGLLGRKVLSGGTTGYRHHPQLRRFRDDPDPVNRLGCYLLEVWEESRRRGYRFDRERLGEVRTESRLLEETRGQLLWEWSHLRAKLTLRSPRWLEDLPETPEAHPLFRLIEGEVRSWEKGFKDAGRISSCDKAACRD